jgi:hypothetical protein
VTGGRGSGATFNAGRTDASGPTIADSISRDRPLLAASGGFGLIASVDIDSSRQALIATLTRFADQIGCVVIAEGIESQAEMITLRSLGVRLGQGYHIARPGPLPIVLNDLWAPALVAGGDILLDAGHRVSF